MKVTWLTQAGLLFEGVNIRIMVDPYLSNSAEKTDPEKARLIPPDERFLGVYPELLLITHEHADHLDLETLKPILENSPHSITVLAPRNAYMKLSKLGGIHNYVMFNPHSVWSQNNVTFYAVHAEHSDPTAIGFIIDDGERTYYVTGDTLYNYDVIDEVLELVEDGVDFVFLPVNGRGNNMNAEDASDFAYEIDAKVAVPIHYGLYDDYGMGEFDFDEVIYLEPYKGVYI